jgi:hypothetical protein
MAKVSLATVGTLTNQVTARATINSNFAALAAAIDNTLSRDGTSPNAMSADLDFNSRRALNLPTPVADSEPVIKGQLYSLVAAAVDQAVEAEQIATAVDIAIDNAVNAPGFPGLFVAVNGSTSPAAHISWGNYRLTNLAPGIAGTDAANVNQTITNATWVGNTLKLQRVSGGDIDLALTGGVVQRALGFYPASASGNLGFFGGVPVAKQTVAGAATDLASAIALVNSIRSALLAYTQVA